MGTSPSAPRRTSAGSGPTCGNGAASAGSGPTCGDCAASTGSAPTRGDSAASTGSRLTRGDVAAWLVKTSRPPAVIEPGWSPGEVRTLQRCVRATYRLGLMTPGQVCLLWLSGQASPGVHAIGTLAVGPGGEEPVDTVDAPGGPVVTLALRLLSEPVPRRELMAAATFASAEVARMPAGSNPSYLTAPQLEEVLARLP